MGQIQFKLWFDNLTLAPGASGTFFEDNVSQAEDKLCWFTAVPLSPLIDDFIANDQVVQITNVFHVLKGKNRAGIGASRAGALRLYVTVRNLDRVNSITFQLYKAEISRWQMLTEM